MLTIRVNDDRIVRFLRSNPIGDICTAPFFILHGPGGKYGWVIVPQNEQG